METAHVERTFCFVGLAGFTALTEAHGDTDAVALLERFLTMTRRALEPDVELLKSIGDAVMLAGKAPEATLLSVARIVASCQQTSGFPLPRAGAHHGPAIARDGDYLGGRGEPGLSGGRACRRRPVPGDRCRGRSRHTTVDGCRRTRAAPASQRVRTPPGGVRGVRHGGPGLSDAC